MNMYIHVLNLLPNRARFGLGNDQLSLTGPYCTCNLQSQPTQTRGGIVEMNREIAVY